MVKRKMSKHDYFKSVTVRNFEQLRIVLEIFEGDFYDLYKINTGFVVVLYGEHSESEMKKLYNNNITCLGNMIWNTKSYATLNGKQAIDEVGYKLRGRKFAYVESNKLIIKNMYEILNYESYWSFKIDMNSECEIDMNKLKDIKWNNFKKMLETKMEEGK